MAMLNIKLQEILKMRTEVKVDSMVDIVYVVVLRIFRVYSIPNNCIHQCSHLHIDTFIQLIFIFSVPGIAKSSVNKQQT